MGAGWDCVGAVFVRELSDGAGLVLWAAETVVIVANAVRASMKPLWLRMFKNLSVYMTAIGVKMLRSNAAGVSFV
jgi:hypothetical protein